MLFGGALSLGAFIGLAFGTPDNAVISPFFGFLFSLFSFAGGVFLYRRNKSQSDTNSPSATRKLAKTSPIKIINPNQNLTHPNKAMESKPVITVFRIILTGAIQKGYNLSQVTQSLSDLFKVDIKMIDKLFQKAPSILKGNINEQLAVKYKLAVEKCGAVCVVAKNKKPGVTNRKSKTTTVQAGTQANTSAKNLSKGDNKIFKCPKCGVEQPLHTNECTNCGIIISKYNKNIIKRANAQQMAEIVLKVLNCFLPQKDLFLKPNIPTDKLDSAKHSCRIPYSETVLGLIDLTFTGSAENSLVFTPNGIYYHNGGKSGKLLYSQFADRKFKLDWGSTISTGEETNIETGGSHCSGDTIFTILKVLQKALIGADGLNDATINSVSNLTTTIPQYQCPYCNSFDIAIEIQGMKWGTSILATFLFSALGPISGIIGYLLGNRHEGDYRLTCNNCTSHWFLTPKERNKFMNNE